MTIYDEIHHTKRSSSEPEMHMWAALLELTFQDALGNTGNGVKRGDRERIIRQARLWFESRREAVGSFCFTCRTLGINPEWARKHILSILDRQVVKAA